MATAKSDEQERRATADWKALRRVQALFVNTTQLCLAEVQQALNYNPELENLRIQQDPRLYQQPVPYQTTGFPAQPYRPPQTPQVPYPGNQVYPQSQTQPTQPLPPYFQPRR